MYVIYSKGCREALSKVTRIAKIKTFTRIAKFTIIGKTIDIINEIYSKSCREGPSKVTRIAKNYKIYENCEIYDNLPDHLQNQ